jgi:hypothetical protein
MIYKKIYNVGLLAYALLLLFAALFFKERVALFDTAFFSFEITRNGDFWIPHYRYISGLIQVLPVLGTKLGLSLAQVELLFSLNFVVYQFLCYLACGYLFRDYRMGVALLVFQTLFAVHTIYWPISELIHAQVLLFPFLAFICNERLRQRKLPTAIVLIAFIPTIAFAHALASFAFFFALAFLYLRKELPFRFALLAGMLYITAFVIKLKFFKTPYDEGAMTNLNNIKYLFPHYFNLHSNKTFLYNCLVKYQWIPISFIGISALYISTRQWLKLVLMTASILVFMFIINVSYHSAGVQEFYIENFYLALGTFLGIPLVLDLLPVLEQRKKHLALVTVALILITAAVRILAVGQRYERRLNWLRSYDLAHRNQKLMIDARHAPQDILYMHWSTPYEFWLVSTIERDTTASILFTDMLPQTEWAMWERLTFVPTWGIYPYKDLPQRYFKMRDTVNHYTIIR